MFSIFKKKVAAIIANAPSIVSHVSAKEKVAEIHNAFDIAGDVALIEANTVLSKAADEALIEKAERLKSLGFTSMKEVVDLNKDVSDKKKAALKADIVSKYSTKYPQYKFIFESQVKEICKKYGLVCGTVNLYLGTIPDKNIAEIAAFKVSDDDTYATEQYQSDGYKYTMTQVNEKLARQEIKLKECDESALHKGRREYEKVPFYICAPEKDMHIHNHRKNGVMLIPDPIVLHWVPEGYLIVSKWGLEGQDPDLTNEKMN